MATKRIGILTAGGDCPGLNAVIRAVVKAAIRHSPAIEVIGILDGYAGLVEDRTRPLHDDDVSGILPRGGTILGTSNRDNPFKYLSGNSSTPTDRSKDAIQTLSKHNIDGLICIGGDGTLTCASRFIPLGVPVIGVPKTIDNDLSGTDITFGFDSALTIATEAVDRLHSTAESHHRVLICEVMGRNAGWIALRAGTAGGGDVILIPEIPYSIDAVCKAVVGREKKGRNFSLLVVAEGARATDGQVVTQGTYKEADHRPRLGGVSHVIAQQIEAELDEETRVVILGHLQRGGTPTAFDRWLATHLGLRAIELAAAGTWNVMTAFRNNQFTHVPIAEAIGKNRRVEAEGPEVQAIRKVGTSFGN